MAFVVSDLIAYVEDCHAVATGEIVSDDSNICTPNFSSYWSVSGVWRNQRKTFLSEPELWKQFRGLFQASERGVKVCVCVCVFKCLVPLGTATGPAAMAKLRWLVEKVPGRTRQWTLLGKHTSPKCVASLVGIHSRRLLNAVKGKLDHRFRCNGAVTKLHLPIIVFGCQFHQFPIFGFTLPTLRLGQKWLSNEGRWMCSYLVSIKVQQGCFQTSFLVLSKVAPWFVFPGSAQSCRNGLFEVQTIWSIQDISREVDGDIGFIM